MFPSSVDREHFAKATNGIAVASDLPKSKLMIGYYGVLDERIDYNLIADVAKKLPWASFVFVGPFAKVNYNDVPKADNIFYMGIKSYEELPKLFKSIRYRNNAICFKRSNKVYQSNQNAGNIWLQKSQLFLLQ